MLKQKLTEKFHEALLAVLPIVKVRLVCNWTSCLFAARSSPTPPESMLAGCFIPPQLTARRRY